MTLSCVATGDREELTFEGTECVWFPNGQKVPEWGGREKEVLVKGGFAKGDKIGMGGGMWGGAGPDVESEIVREIGRTTQSKNQEKKTIYSLYIDY